MKFSYLNLDAGVLFSYHLKLRKGALLTMAGPLLGVKLSEGEVLLKSEGVTSTYSIPQERLVSASLGGVIRSGYAFSAGPGVALAGAMLTYHYTSVKGFLTEEHMPVGIVAAGLSVGYFFEGNSNEKRK
jgi:hypothetical protein